MGALPREVLDSRYPPDGGSGVHGFVEVLDKPAEFVLDRRRPIAIEPELSDELPPDRVENLHSILACKASACDALFLY